MVAENGTKRVVFKRVETQSVETECLTGTPICKCVTHSLTHSGVDTLHNQSDRTRPPKPNVGIATEQSKLDTILK